MQNIKRRFSRKRYEDYEPGEWIRPTRRAYKLKCCDCGLVHRFDFRLAPYGRGKEIQFRLFLDNRATAAARRRKGVYKDIALPKSASQIRKDVGVTARDRKIARTAAAHDPSADEENDD